METKQTKVTQHLSSKDIFYQWCEVTTCSGIIDWKLSETKFAKTFWFLILLLCFGLTIWQSTKTVEDFLCGNPYETTISLITEERPLFPNVTICNFNRIDKSLIGNISEDVLSYALMDVIINYFSIIFDSNESVNALLQLKNKFDETMKNYNLTNVVDIYRKFGHTCESIMVGCMWNGYKFDCCKHAIEFINPYGRCWTILPRINSKKNERPEFAGIMYGIQVILNPKLSTSMANMIYNNLYENGFLVTTAYHELAMIDDFQAVAPGAHTWINIEATLHDLDTLEMPLTPPPCTTDEKLMYFDVHYSYESCLWDCWMLTFYSRTNCAFGAPIKSNYRICNATENLLYNDLYYNKRYGYSAMNATFECQKGCRYPCRAYWSLRSSISSTNFVGNTMNPSLMNYVHHLFGNDTDGSNEHMKSLSSVNVYFSALEYRLMVTKERNPLFTFIGNIGGQLSLWLGISILTILQVLYYCCKCIKYSVYEEKLQNK